MSSILPNPFLQIRCNTTYKNNNVLKKNKLQPKEEADTLRTLYQGRDVKYGYQKSIWQNLQKLNPDISQAAVASRIKRLKEKEKLPEEARNPFTKNAWSDNDVIHLKDLYQKHKNNPCFKKEIIKEMTEKNPSLTPSSIRGRVDLLKKKEQLPPEATNPSTKNSWTDEDTVRLNTLCQNHINKNCTKHDILREMMENNPSLTHDCVKSRRKRLLKKLEKTNQAFFHNMPQLSPPIPPAATSLQQPYTFLASFPFNYGLFCPIEFNPLVNQQQYMPYRGLTTPLIVTAAKINSLRDNITN